MTKPVDGLFGVATLIRRREGGTPVKPLTTDAVFATEVGSPIVCTMTCLATNEPTATRSLRLRTGWAPFVALIGGVMVAPACVNWNTPGTNGGPPGADGAAGDDDGAGPVDDDGENRPSVTLEVSNPTPQLNEEVVFTCSLASASGAGETLFEFQPENGRLAIDADRGTAVFIVQESDIGVAFTFTCTATNDNGTSEPSNPRIIIPS